MWAIIFALGFNPVASHAGWVAGPKGSSSILSKYKSTKGGELAFEYQARRVIGTYVQNREGDYLGKITDLMIEPQKGGITFAVLARGGVLGIPMRFVAVPFSALTSSNRKHVYLLDMSEEKMAAAPSFDRNQWPDVANRGWEIDTYRYYGQSPNWGESGKPIAKPMAQNWSKAYDFKKIVGAPVKNQQGEELGTIYDMVVDSQGHVPFAVLSHGGFLGIDEKLVAVPFGSLNFDQMGKELFLNSTKEKLDSAPSFQVSDLSNQKWAGDVYQHFGQHPYWTE